MLKLFLAIPVLFFVGKAVLSLLSQRRIAISSISDVFYIVWYYYALSVPVDLLLGERTRLSLLDTLADLNNETTLPYIIIAVLYYLLCGAGFWLAYRVPRVQDTRVVYKKYHAVILPMWLVIACNLLVATIYVSYTWQYSRQERILLGMSNPLLKYYAFLTTIIYAFDLVTLITSNNRKKALLAVLMGMLIGGLTGGRTWVVFFPLVYAIRYKIAFSKWQIIGMAVLGLLFVIYWKSTYYGLLNIYQGNQVSLSQVFRSVRFAGISGFEAVSSFRIFVTFLERGNSPYWFGTSYFQIPLHITIPRFLSNTQTFTLAEQYTQYFYPSKATRGGGLGFSALAESWLNFGFLGPFFLGIVWGYMAKYLDNRPRGIAFIVFLMMTFRLFRSDFGSLYKSWIILLGGSMILAVSILKVVEMVLNMIRASARIP